MTLLFIAVPQPLYLFSGTVTFLATRFCVMPLLRLAHWNSTAQVVAY